MSPEALAEIERMRAAKREAEPSPAPPRSIEQDRADWDAAALLAPLPKGTIVGAADAGGVMAEWVEMPGVRRDRVVLLLHGGGYTSGSPRTHRKLAACLSRAADARVLVPEYRLAPEHPFPAGLEDATKAYDWLHSAGIGAARIVVAGDSAGAGLAMSLLLALRDGRADSPGAAVLMSAWTDLTTSSPSYDTHQSVELQVTRDGLHAAALHYLGAGDLSDPRVSTIFADLARLPPLLIQVGGDEIMLDDSRILAERARAAGVDATLSVYERMWHVFQFQAPELPEAQAAMDEVAAFIRAHLGD